MFHVCLFLLSSRVEVERKEVAQRLEEWREQKRNIKLEAEQTLIEKIEKRRKEKVYCYKSMNSGCIGCTFDDFVLSHFNVCIFLCSSN